MRIGTWNLGNSWSDQHYNLLVEAQCEVWLLTEFQFTQARDNHRLGSFHLHRSKSLMSQRQHWAAILGLQAFDQLLPDPHTSSAAVVQNGVTYCSSVLPWNRGLQEFPELGQTVGEKTTRTLQAIKSKLTASALVWGGDWNHTLLGAHDVGTILGRKSLFDTFKHFKLQVPTAGMRDQKDQCYSIDHIAVPAQWKVERVERLGVGRLSDHDAYIIDIHDKPESSTR